MNERMMTELGDGASEGASDCRKEQTQCDLKIFSSTLLSALEASSCHPSESTFHPLARIFIILQDWMNAARFSINYLSLSSPKKEPKQRLRGE
jgi:hypothetical protein